MNAIAISGLSKSYFQHQVLENIGLTIPKGSIFGLLGQNGAGKTTLIRIITKILSADSGQVLFKNEPLSDSHTLRMGYMPEERGLYKKMEVTEQLVYLGRLKGLSRTDAKLKTAEWIQRMGLEAWGSHTVEELSKGMQQKIQFIATVLHGPEFIILDEPFSGFDPVNASLLTEEILHLRNEGATILFSTHRMENVEELCDHFAILHQAKVVLEGEKSLIKQQGRQGLYTIRLDGELQEVPGVFSIVESTRLKDGSTVASLQKMRESESGNALLGALLNQGRVVEFREKVPSVAEIFLQYVSKDSRA
ncbi:MAG: ATP-binding cassette domain-containing protein [Cytophagales bacterium]|nr:ATP-binding cassette domain-containing protein [Cytophagales bacterium]